MIADRHANVACVTSYILARYHASAAEGERIGGTKAECNPANHSQTKHHKILPHQYKVSTSEGTTTLDVA
jgi:hypothetical protein